MCEYYKWVSFVVEIYKKKNVWEILCDIWYKFFILMGNLKLDCEEWDEW